MTRQELLTELVKLRDKTRLDFDAADAESNGDDLSNDEHSDALRYANYLHYQWRHLNAAVEALSCIQD